MIEHDTLRAPGAFNDSRVHVAADGTGIDCPRPCRDAFVAERLDAQLDDGAADRRGRRDAAAPTRFIDNDRRLNRVSR